MAKLLHLHTDGHHLAWNAPDQEDRPVRRGCPLLGTAFPDHKAPTRIRHPDHCGHVICVASSACMHACMSQCAYASCQIPPCWPRGAASNAQQAKCATQLGASRYSDRGSKTWYQGSSSCFVDVAAAHKGCVLVASYELLPVSSDCSVQPWWPLARPALRPLRRPARLPAAALGLGRVYLHAGEDKPIC